MFYQSPVKLLQRRSKVIFLVGIILALVASLLTVLFPLEYRADAQLLIISRSRYGVDPYTVVKSAERVGENIAQVMKTSDFYEKVKEEPGYNIDWKYFDGLSERDKRKKWNKSVRGSVVFGTGVLNVSAYHADPNQARLLAGAAASTLVEKGWQYVGGDVSLSVVNNPIVTPWPVRPNVLVNAFVGFIIGVFITGFLVIRKR
ncbi:MAG: hypothetical protein ABII02_01470 [Candidatus Magasanikbacteria bacterium]